MFHVQGISTGWQGTKRTIIIRRKGTGCTHSHLLGKGRFVAMIFYAKVSSVGRTRCAASHHDPRDKASKDEMIEKWPFWGSNMAKTGLGVKGNALAKHFQWGIVCALNRQGCLHCFTFSLFTPLCPNTEQEPPDSKTGLSL
jgi:hypothetical protein